MNTRGGNEDSSLSRSHDRLIDAACDRFEAAWKTGASPRIEEFFARESATAEPSRHVALLYELVVIDLEYRWRDAHHDRSAMPTQCDAPALEYAPGVRPWPARPLLEDYAAWFPQLGPVDQFPVHVIVHEFRVRRRHGDRPARSEYAARFSRRTDVEQALDVVVHNERSPAATEAGSLQIRCPHCHHPVEVVCDAPLEAVTCPSCGSTFNLLGVTETKTYDRADVRTIGHFDLIDQLGVGAMGTVWMARDRHLDRTVALKVPRKGRLDAVEAEHFLREARAAAQLRHPNIVSVHEVGRDGDTIYIVSDFVRGATLADWLTAHRPTAQEAAELGVKLADALDHAHRAGVIHRDLKPSNIMLDFDGEPHVMDFGLAKREAGEITMTVDGRVLGTPAYMSPEQARGEGHYADRRSDVYSLGVILYELLTGELPFRGNTRMLMVQILNDDPPALRKLNATVPRDLETICLKCLEKEPARRYETARELGDELRRFLAGEPIHARPIGRATRLLKWYRRNRLVASLGLLAVVLGCFGAVAVLGTIGILASDSLSVSQSREVRQVFPSGLFAFLMIVPVGVMLAIIVNSVARDLQRFRTPSGSASRQKAFRIYDLVIMSAILGIAMIVGVVTRPWWNTAWETFASFGLDADLLLLTVPIFLLITHTCGSRVLSRRHVRIRECSERLLGTCERMLAAPELDQAVRDKLQKACNELKTQHAHLIAADRRTIQHFLIRLILGNKSDNASNANPNNRA